MTSSMWDSVVASFQESMYENGDVRVENWPLVYNPWVIIAIVVAYIAACILGPRIMASRKPFELKPVLVVYNAAMVILSFYIVKEMVVCALQLKYNFICDPIEYKTEPVYMRLAAGIWFFYFSKVIEFLDTIFFILRKKDSQITFLHVYHHSSMFFIWWTAIKWFAGGMAFFPPMVNCSVHVIMYAYYGLSLFPSLRKYLWWKKYVTLLQLGQFVFVIFLTLYNLITGCKYDRRVQWTVAVYVTTQLILFINFYSKSYGKKPRKSKSETNGSSSEAINGRDTNSSICNGSRNYEEDEIDETNRRVRKRT